MTKWNFPEHWGDDAKILYLKAKVEQLRDTNNDLVSRYHATLEKAQEYDRIVKIVSDTPALQSEWQNFLVLVKLSS